MTITRWIRNRGADDQKGLIDYRHYRLTGQQYAVSWLIAATLLFSVGFLFYQHSLPAMMFMLAAFAYPPIRQRQLRDRRQRELGSQFKEALYSISSSLAAGRSVENAFREAVSDLQLLYPDPDTYIVREFEIICLRLDYEEPIEQGITDFAMRAGLDDLANFANVFVTCKRTGGDLVQVVRRTSQMISEKLEIQQEIAVMVAQKRFESKLLMVMPIALIGLLQLTAPDYMAPLYGGIGYILITISLLLIAASYYMIHRIMNIRI